MYEYKAKCKRVVDGDTIQVIVDLGFNTMRNETLRFSLIDTPETRTRNLLHKDAGLLVKEYVRELIEGKEIFIRTEKDDDGKFGRYLANIYLNIDDEKSLNEELLELNYAKLYGDGKEWNGEKLKYIVESLKISNSLSIFKD